MPVPTLTTNRLTLRGFGIDDWDDYAAMCADPDVQEFLGGRTMTREESWTSMAYSLGVWELRGHGQFAVTHQGRFVGRVGLYHPVDWPEPELAWTIAKPFWGQGFATEAASCVRDWSFRQFGWPRLVSFIDPRNHRSQHVARKLGAVNEGAIVLRDTTVDQWVHPAPGRGVVV